MLIAQNNMSDSEFYIVDVADGCEFEIEGEEVRKKGRGKDIYLVEYATFEKPERFKFSKVFNEIKESMTKKKEWKTMEARKEQYICKFSQKRGYKVCLRQYMVAYSNTSMKILVFHTPEEPHIHEEDEEYFTKENYSWTSKQEAIVVQVFNNHTPPTLPLPLPLPLPPPSPHPSLNDIIVRQLRTTSIIH